MSGKVIYLSFVKRPTSFFPRKRLA